MAEPVYAQQTLGKLLWIPEKTWPGTLGATAAGVVIPFISETMDQTRNLIVNKAIRGTRNPAPLVLGKSSYNGTISMNMDISMLGWVLKAAFGDAVDTGADPYLHTYKLGTTRNPVSIEKGFTDIAQYLWFKGCYAKALKFKVNDEGISTVDVDLVGQTMVQGTSSQVVSPTTYTNAPISDLTASITIGGSAFALGQMTDLTINLPTDEKHAIGGAGDPGFLPAGIADISGNITMFFKDDVEYLKARSSTTFAIVLTWTFSGSPSYYFKLTLGECIYKPSAPKVGGNTGTVDHQLAFQAFYASNADATAVKAELQNHVASYPTPS